MIHLITYGDSRFIRAKKRLCEESIATGWFDSITTYSPNDLDNDFTDKFKTILQQNRGGGYWIWKPYFIKKHLDIINDNDILIYLDAGCSINPHGKNRFDEYIEMLNKSDTGCISFQMGHTESIWTTKEIFEYFNIEDNDSITTSGQILGGIQIIKKNSNSIKLVNLWIQTLHDNPLLFTDHYNTLQDHSYFKDNRHDQSVFSVIRKMNCPILLEDETYFEFGSEMSLKYPFWATRKQ